MLDKFKIVGLIIAGFVLAGCPEKEDIEFAETPIDSNDESDQSKFELFYSNAGGMTPESENIYISNDSASWKYGRYLKETIVSWQPLKEDVKVIIDVLNENNYAKIESTEKEGVFDRGGIQLKIVYRDAITKINNSGLSFVKDEWRDNFTAIKNCVKEYTDNEVKKQCLDLSFKTENSILQSEEPFTVWLNNELFYDSQKENHQPSEKHTVYPGLNRFSWTIYFADSLKYNNDPVFKYGGQNNFDVQKGSKEIGIKREGNEILLFAN